MTMRASVEAGAGVVAMLLACVLFVITLVAIFLAAYGILIAWYEAGPPTLGLALWWLLLFGVPIAAGVYNLQITSRIILDPTMRDVRRFVVASFLALAPWLAIAFYLWLK
jgi:hypothetical protein